MPWSNESYQVTCTGELPGDDEFSNTWSFNKADPGADIADLEAGLIGFYSAIEDRLSPEWILTNMRIKNLGTGVYVDQPQAALAGTAVGDPLPPQCAVRVSLKAPPNINGGPFLAGFATDALDSNGQVLAAAADDIADQVVIMQNNLAGNDWLLGIARPSLEQIATATLVRVGLRWDVIRRRASDQAEFYDTRVF